MRKNTVKFKLTDQGNAERFVAHWQDEARYVADIGWHIWKGGRWVYARGGQEVELAKKTVRAMYGEAAQCRDDDEYRAALAEHAIKCESGKRIVEMLRLAKSDPLIAITPDQLDADPFALNVQNGVVDLRTGKLRPHDPKELHTKQCPVNYDPAAMCPMFLAFIGRIFGNNEPLIFYVQKLLGNAVTGDNSTQYLPIFHGQGANGKSTLLGCIQHILGTYAGSAPDSLLTVGRQEHSTELYDLKGMRLVIASETEDGAKLKIQLVKKLTGETSIKARKMYQDFFEFRRSHHIFLQTNNRPRVTEDSEAVWRRIRLVPFEVIIRAPERDPLLLEKLIAEASGILSWLIIGCLAWQKEGLEMPREVEDANRHYREESDPLGDFVDDCCAVGPEMSCAAGQLRLAYEKFCTERGIKPLPGNAFADRLKKRGYTAARNHAGRLWVGVGLLCSQHEYAGEV